MRKIAFIINPNAGKKRKIELSTFIKENISNAVQYEILIWDPIEKFDSLKNYYLNQNFDVVVACGGDGTVNAVASSLTHTEIALGILPLGSGNGLARSLGYPMDLKKALNFVCTQSIIAIDANKIDAYYSFCAAGIGFDAHVAQLFANSQVRGLKTYIKLALSAYFKYKDKSYQLTIDGQNYQETAFLITFANAPQYGNNAFIAPDASLQDGQAEIVLLKKFPMIYAPIAAIRLFNKTIYKSKYIKRISGKNISISYFGDNSAIHADGEPHPSTSPLKINVVPKCLKVVSSL